MDTLEKQLLAVQEKVDALYQIIEQLNVKFLAAIDTGKVKLNPEAKDTVNINYSKYSNPWYQSYGDSSMEHKDVLKDHRAGESSSQASGQQAMSTELQIQRLTAQLTAAYNRIAALEEQLVARRVHH
jgi:hypothetical protein